jgi:hypothetical protein
LALLYVLLLAIGSALLYWSQDGGAAILGIGLMLPGGGFLALPDTCLQSPMSHTAVAIGVLATFVASLLLWFGTGNVLMPPFIWLGSAIWAASMANGPIRIGIAQEVYSGLLLFAGLLLLSAVARDCLARRQRRIDNAYLAACNTTQHTLFTECSDMETIPEMSPMHLQRLRFALDRALQPLSEFNGFEHRDQFQTAATRYQLNFLGYGIALTQARFTPAFDGYMTQAQLALIDKQSDYRVWSYWRLENLWGNLCSNPDPTARDNIMFTGFVALQMGLLRASSGSQVFEKQGRFALQTPSGNHYSHNVESLVASVECAYTKSPFFLVACEPNWIYPLCNAIGATAVMALDAQHGQNRWQAYAPSFRTSLESEFLDGFGRYIPCRSTYTGLPFPAFGGAMPLAMPCYFLNTVAPDLARRQWLLLRRDILNRKGQLRRRAFWPIDTGNYRFSRASAYATTALAAIELGDNAVHDACMQALEQECPSTCQGGVMHRPLASVWAHGVELMVLASKRDSFRKLITTPFNPKGIRLVGLKYPDVLVASAHASENELHAILYCGYTESDADCTVSMGLTGLKPLLRYCITGTAPQQFHANSEGNATLLIRIAGRTCLHVRPAELSP